MPFLKIIFEKKIAKKYLKTTESVPWRPLSLGSVWPWCYCRLTISAYQPLLVCLTVNWSRLLQIHINWTTQTAQPAALSRSPNKWVTMRMHTSVGLYKYMVQHLSHQFITIEPYYHIIFPNRAKHSYFAQYKISQTIWYCFYVPRSTPNPNVNRILEN